MATPILAFDLPSRGTVLLVDDDPAIARAYQLVLSRAGFAVTSAGSAAEAVERLDKAPFDAVLSDIAMPGLTGVDLVRAFRAKNNAVPVVLMTGNPTVETAMAAVEYGVVRYLQKPVDIAALEDAVQLAVERGRVERQRSATGQVLSLAERARLDELLTEGLDRAWMVYQPIVRASNQTVAAFEALVRTTAPGLENPRVFVETAAKLSRSRELARTVRGRVAEALASAPDISVCVNIEPADLDDPDLYAPEAPLSRHAGRVILEVTERESLSERDDLREEATRLRALGYRIAVDDLGAGYAGLLSIAELSPEVIKLDMALVRNAAQEPLKRSLMSALVAHCQRHGTLVIAEGIETREEQKVVTELGCDLLQGYLFGKPRERFTLPVGMTRVERL